MNPDLHRQLLAALERPHRLGTIGGDLEEQLAHCASFSSVLGQVAPDSFRHGLDLGTGGGLPGLALAGHWTQVSWTLVDMRAARADEVERTALRLGLADRVQVIAAEAQMVGHDEAYREAVDVVVARAFGPPALTAECAAGVVRVGGVFVVSEPPAAASDEQTKRWPGTSLARLGLSQPALHEHGGHRFAVFTKEASAPANIPRLPPRPKRGWF